MTVLLVLGKSNTVHCGTMFMRSLVSDGPLPTLLAESVSAETLAPTEHEPEVIQWNCLHVSLAHVTHYRMLLQSILTMAEGHCSALKRHVEFAKVLQSQNNVVLQNVYNTIQSVLCFTESIQTRTEALAIGVTALEQEVTLCEQSIVAIDTQVGLLQSFAATALSKEDQVLVAALHTELKIARSVLSQLLQCSNRVLVVQKELLTITSDTQSRTAGWYKALRDVLL